jgi:flavin reductase (DIM6/NTAB) family NADH-FMN oxidoreductase RutF
MKNFRKVDPAEINENVIKLIGHQWMLITAGNMDSYNTMTASWGGIGMLWNKPVVFIFVRPQRYTFRFVETSDFFTCSFFDAKYKSALRFCGTHTGRDFDKADKTGLTPMPSDSGSVIFNEARLVLESRKLYFQDIDPKGFMSPEIQENYPLKDYHRMYIGEITFCGIKDEI